MDAKVFDWRRAQLEKAGYSFDQAVNLAASTCDLHEACDMLLVRKCDPATAFDCMSDEPA